MVFDTHRHGVTAQWTGGFDEAGLQAWAEQLREAGPRPGSDLGLVFMSPSLFADAPQILEILRVHARVPLLAGCSSTSLISDGREVEDASGLVLGLYQLPGAELKAVRISQSQLDEATGPESWHDTTQVKPEATNGWLVFADPFHLDGESWLEAWNEAYPGLPIVGGLAGGDHTRPRTQVYLNGEVFEEGGVALSIGGDVRLTSVISQGCTPIGQPWTITRAEGNLISQIANRPAYEVLIDTYNALTEDQQRRTQGNLFVGLVINEYREDFQRGDFLIRNLLGFDPASGTLAVGARPRAGQTLQFQTRDSTAATEDLTELLRLARLEASGKQLFGACLCSCNGRGARLFGGANHDAALAQKHLGPLPLTGFFCNGEIGPVGSRNFLHGYTAALALFVEK